MKGRFTYRLKYEKNNDARYISHLDFVRLIGRALRRAELPVTYTQGFNPHPVISVAAPISVGVTSECEYMDIGFDEALPVCELVDRLNRVLPSGIVVHKAKVLDPDDCKLSAITSARYLVKTEMKNTTPPGLDSFLGLSEIIVSKKSKSGVSDVDIKKGIYDLKLVSHDGLFADFEVEVAAGSGFNVKPELVFEAMQKYLPGFKIEFMLSHRLSLMAKGKALM